MNRESFFGGKTKELVLYKWPITDLGTCEIGFGFCEKTGLVLQTTAVTPEMMIKYYANTATYLNPNHDGNPMPGKVKDLDRLLQTIKFTLGRLPSSVLQLGSSDGYTLSCFRAAGAKRILGVEPSEKSREFAFSQYGVESLPDSAESFDTNEKFDLVVLTHVLEHFYDPLFVLRKLYKNLDNDGHILIEVPLWERLDKQPVGVLNFEHVNYFSEDTLIFLLYSAGYEPVYSAKLFGVNQYPVITVIAKKFEIDYPIKKYCAHSKSLLESYLIKEKYFWLNVGKKILAQYNPSHHTYIYGAGIHTSQLLSKVKILDTVTINGVIDSSPTKWGKEIAGFVVEQTGIIDELPFKSNVIISSAASEEYIYEALARRRTGLNLIRLYK